MIVCPKTKKTSTEDSFTASEKTSITHSSDSNSTYSTSAFDSDIETSSTLTLNTLSMITTPWTTESWSGTLVEYDSYSEIGSSIFSSSEESISETMSSTMSTTTHLPRSSTSYGPPTPLLPSSRTTLTILNGKSINTNSNSIKLMTRQNSKILSETFSSWTVETFTSSGWVSDLDSKVIKVKYPWSPNSVMSGTDIYPSTLDTLTSRKGSRATIATTSTFESSKGEKGHTPPMNYIGLTNRPGADELMKWAQVKRIPSITAAM